MKVLLFCLIHLLSLGLVLSQDAIETAVDNTVRPKLTGTPVISHAIDHIANTETFLPSESPTQKPWRPSPRICLRGAQSCTSSQECCSGICNIISIGVSICTNGYSFPVYDLNRSGLTQSTYGGGFKKGGFKKGGGYKKVGGFKIGGFKKGGFKGGKYGKLGSGKYGKFKG